MHLLILLINNWLGRKEKFVYKEEGPDIKENLYSLKNKKIKTLAAILKLPGVMFSADSSQVLFLDNIQSVKDLSPG